MPHLSFLPFVAFALVMIYVGAASLAVFRCCKCYRKEAGLPDLPRACAPHPNPLDYQGPREGSGGALYLLGLTLWVLAGCDTPSVEPEGSDSFVTFELNGEAWENTMHPFTPLRNGGFSTSASRFASGNNPYHIDFNFVLDRMPDLKINISDSSYVNMFLGELDGDVLISVYYPSEAAGVSELVFDKVDLEELIVEGSFKGTFVIDPSRLTQPRRALPDTVEVANGRFRLELLDRR